MVIEFRKRVVPKLLPSNPGISVAGKVRFSNVERRWNEHYHLVTAVASVLEERQHLVQSEESCVLHENTGFILLPRLVNLQPLDEGGVRTTTTIQIHHPALIPDGVFEYQHSTGDNVQDSIRKGFEQWAEMDLVVLLEALQRKPATCRVLKADFAEQDGKPAYSRRAVLGPVTHLVQNSQIYADQKTPESPESRDGAPGEQCERHEFCRCCLLTNSFDAFKELIEGTGFYGLRLFALRDEKGTPQADCRVNGNDWQKGAEALRKYVTTWPEAGYEFRRQYVVLQTVEKES